MLFNYILLIIMVLVWSFSFIIADIAVEFISPLNLALYRFLIASVSFIFIDIYLTLIKQKQNNKVLDKAKLKDFTKNDWILLVLSSFSGVSLFMFAQYTSVKLIGPSLPALFVCLLAPVIISILALIFFQEKLNKLKIIGFILASIGGFLLVTGGNIKNITPNSPNFIGYFFGLMTPILWAIYSTFTKKLTNHISTMKLNKYISYLGLIELLFLVVVSQEFVLFIESFLSITLFLCSIYLGIGCYVIGYYIWQKAQTELKSFKVASFLYAEPFLTLIFSSILQRNESIVLWNIFGGVIVLVAVLIINYK